MLLLTLILYLIHCKNTKYCPIDPSVTSKSLYNSNDAGKQDETIILEFILKDIISLMDTLEINQVQKKIVILSLINDFLNI